MSESDQTSANQHPSRGKCPLNSGVQAGAIHRREAQLTYLGPPVVPFCPFLGEGSPTKIGYRTKGTLFVTSLLDDLVMCPAKPPVRVRTGQDPPRTSWDG